MYRIESDCTPALPIPLSSASKVGRASLFPRQYLGDQTSGQVTLTVFSHLHELLPIGTLSRKHSHVSTISAFIVTLISINCYVCNVTSDLLREHYYFMSFLFAQLCSGMLFYYSNLQFILPSNPVLFRLAVSFLLIHPVRELPLLHSTKHTYSNCWRQHKRMLHIGHRGLGDSHHPQLYDCTYIALL